MNYQINISPVTKNQTRVIQLLIRFLGPSKKEEAKIIATQGGVVMKNINKETANAIANQLLKLGVSVEVINMRPETPSELFRVRLVDAGRAESAVIGLILDITKLSMKEVEEIVYKRGIVAENIGIKEAVSIKNKLEATGAKILIEEMSSVEPKPEPKPEPTDPVKPHPEPSIDSEHFVLYGTVNLENKKSPVGIVVQAFDRDLRSEELLGKQSLDEKGNYSIKYYTEQFKNKEKKSADIIIRAYNSIGILLVESDIHFNVKAKQEINLLISKTTTIIPSRYEVLLAGIVPLLDGLSLSELNNDDIWFLANESENAIHEIKYLIEDNRLASTTEIPNSVFFALALANIGVVQPEERSNSESKYPELSHLDLSLILEEKSSNLIATLTQALKDTLIPEAIKSQLGKIEEQFISLKSSREKENIGTSKKYYNQLFTETGINKETATLLSDHLFKTQLQAETFKNIVKEGIVSEKEAKTISLIYQVGEFTQNNIALTGILVNKPPSKLDGKLESIRDLAILDEKDWEEILDIERIDIPNGKTAKNYALELTKQVEVRFPTTVFQKRYLNYNSEFLKKVIKTDPLSKEVASFRHTYKYMGVAELLDNKDLKESEKIILLGKRTTAIDSFFSNNPNLELKTHDFLNLEDRDNKASYAEIDEDLKPLLKQQMMAYQRVLTVSPDIVTSKLLLSIGYDSARAIAEDSIETITIKTGVNLERANQIKLAAQDITMRSAINQRLWMDASSLHGTSFNAVPTSRSVDFQLKNIEEFKNLIGVGSYCSCNHCSSVLGPSAYFVDLMSFIEKHVKVQIAGNGSIQHQNLKARRPDLWDLELSCKNSNTLISYLDIINNVLERFIGGDAYLKLSESDQSFLQPFNLPLEQLLNYLDFFKADLLQITEHNLGWGTRTAQITLGLSPETWSKVTRSGVSDVYYLKYYGMKTMSSIIDVQQFIRIVGIDRNQLETLLSLKSIVQNNDVKIVLNEDVAGVNYEEIVNMTTSVLSRIYLFIRLWKNLPWKMHALDYILRNFADKYLLPNASKEDKSAALIFIANFRDIQKRSGNLPIEIVISLSNYIPNEATVTANSSYFDVLFNEGLGDNSKYDRWTIDEGPDKRISPESKLSYRALFAVEDYIIGEEEIALQNRLLRALSLNETELRMLINNLFSTPNYDGELILTHQNISLLYRYAFLAKRFNISIDMLFSALRWLQNEENATIDTFTDVRNLLDFFDWQIKSGSTVQDLDSILVYYADKKGRFNIIKDIEFLRSKLNLDSKTIQFIVSHSSIFKINDEEVLGLDNLRLIFGYFKLNKLFEVKNHLLLDFLTSPTIDVDVLAELLDNTKEYIQSFIMVIPSEILSVNDDGNRIDILRYLLRSLMFGNKLGVDGRNLKLLCTEDSKELNQVQDLMLNSIRSKQKDDLEFKLKIEPYINKLRNRRRDALVDYLLHLSVENEYKNYFTTKSDLYYYFLLDTELEACASSSLIVAATNSIQLYLHRCFMGLEKGIYPSLEMIEEWPWRKNYRVWEANRKVFLYPENYLEPNLRDNKTPAFQELEKSLLQQDINRDTVEAAYTNYLKEFTTVANLKIIGSCYDPDTKTTHLFGRNPSEPERIFQRQMRKIGYKLKLSIVSEEEYAIEWSPWEELSIQINAKYVSPVIIKGRMHIFWVERMPMVKTKINGEEISSINYSNYKLKLSRGKLDGGLGQPIEITMRDSVETNEDFILDLKVYPFEDDDNIYIIRRKQGSMSGLSDDPSYNQPLNNGNFPHNVLKVDLFSNTLKKSQKKPEKPRLILLERIVYKQLNKMGLFLSSSKIKPNDFEADAAGFVRLMDDKVLGVGLLDNLSVGLLQGVCHSRGSYFVESNNQSFLLDLNFLLLLFIPIPYFKMISLSTPVAKQLFSKFLNTGVDNFLTRDTQQLSEPELPFIILQDELLKHQKPPKDQLDFNGAYGLYYQELFLHIPLLIANQLNANQHFEDAQRWYHYVFNPINSNLPPNQESVNNGKPAKSNLWNYLEFLKDEPLKMSEILQDGAALEQYKRDPFNPHAIARLRLSAYQKSVAMKYIDNLLDWGDHLFFQDTRESINEATLLYIMAADLLGKRPVELGSCKPVGMESKKPMTYANIKTDNEFLPVFENMAATSLESSRTSTNQGLLASSVLPEFQQAFCISVNKEMLAYWDRMEDRLFKVRNCMNLSGVRRELALFAPPIDPALLVRAKAAGLSIGEALEVASPIVPNYRFIYLLEKAKSFTSTVQSFGSDLLSALTSKDSEELMLLRETHQKNILNLSTQLKSQQVETAKENLDVLKLNLESAKFREGYHTNLINEGLSKDEEESLDTMNSANKSNRMANIMKILASYAQLAPDLGSPLAFLYGGKHIGQSLSMHASAIEISATEDRNKSAISSILGSYERREQTWEYQKELSSQEVTQLEKQLIGAEIRLDMAERELRIHEESIVHGEELFDFYRNKFTNSGLFTWLSSELNKLHRTVYNMAHELALQAQKAYGFERNDMAVDFIKMGNWDTQKAGLLSGEKMLIHLLQMEKSFLETDLRKQEINQAFSLTLLSPVALLDLKSNGECEFIIPELFFDLFYPGQYKRKIKSVRLTIPSVTGPYTNVSAVLSLTKSYMRMDIQDSSELVILPSTLFSSISTSTAQNDAGIFELNFNGEKYLPFEGAGAISHWNLSLPKTFRQFDYNTISDVIIHINYTAEYDASFRERIESVQTNNESKILQHLKNESNFLSRTFSFRKEFSNDFHRLTVQRKNTIIIVKILKSHFPFFLHNQKLKVKSAKLILITPAYQSVNGFEMKLNGIAVTEFEKDADFGNLLTAKLNNNFNDYITGDHAISIVEGGALAPASTIGKEEAVDLTKLEDIILYMEYYLA